MRTLGRRGEKKTPLSQKSKIFASSPMGRAKAAFGGRLLDKLKFDNILPHLAKENKPLRMERLAL